MDRPILRVQYWYISTLYFSQHFIYGSKMDYLCESGE